MSDEEPEPTPDLEAGRAKLGLLVSAAYALGGGAYSLAQRRYERSEPCAKCGEIIVDTKISANYTHSIGWHHPVCPKKETPKVPKAASALPD